MKRNNLILGGYLFLISMILFGCREAEQPFIPNDNLPRIMTSHFDLAGLVKSDVKLVMSGGSSIPSGQIESQAPSGEYTSQSLIRYPEGYKDSQGNLYQGSITYTTNMEGMTAGKREKMVFHNFSINGVGVDGEKVSSIVEMTDDGREISKVNWCEEEPEGEQSPEKPNRGMRLSTPDGTLDLGGCVSKILDKKLYEEQGRLVYYIEGEMTGNLNEEGEWNFRIVAGLSHGEEGCRWYERGLVRVSNGDNTFEMDMGNNDCQNQFKVNFGQETKYYDRYHNFWN